MYYRRQQLTYESFFYRGIWQVQPPRNLRYQQQRGCDCKGCSTGRINLRYSASPSCKIQLHTDTHTCTWRSHKEFDTTSRCNKRHLNHTDLECKHLSWLSTPGNAQQRCFTTTLITLINSVLPWSSGAWQAQGRHCICRYRWTTLGCTACLVRTPCCTNIHWLGRDAAVTKENVAHVGPKR